MAARKSGTSKLTVESLKRKTNRRKVEDIKDPAIKAMVEDSLIDQMSTGAPRNPFTRFELPDDVDTVEFPNASDSFVKYKRHRTTMYCPKDLQAAKNLRTELLYSLELLNFYIDQVEKEGRIRYTR